VNVIVLLVVGCLFGGVASVVMHSPGGISTNIVIGIAGTFVGGLLLAPLFGVANLDSGDFSTGSLVVALLGATVLLGVINLIRRAASR
jgi:uncharacterized membrane protein YeaQ/YmgE (transglycosylase-associated protein family)